MRFPLGDSATWINSDVEADDVTARRLVGAGLDAATAKRVVDAGLRRRSPTFGDDFLLDIGTGLPFRWDEDGPHLARDVMYRSAHDIVDARYFRMALAGSAPIGPVIVHGFGTGGAIDRLAPLSRERELEFLSAPIVNYEADSVADCEHALQEIAGILRNGPYFRRLWLRGQTREYTFARSGSMAELCITDEPSLVPSLGRHALAHPGDVDEQFAFMGPNHWWLKPILLWFIRQNPQWLNHYPQFMDRLEQSLRSDDDDRFARLLLDIQLDPRVPGEVDDLRQWFFAYFKFDIVVLVLQQYGYLASVLDLTDDLDVALFFAQAKMVNGAFELPAAKDGRLIYVFAESHESTSFQDATRMSWGDLEWLTSIPARVAAQRAGCLVGSTYESQNLYGNLVVARIWLRGSALTFRTVSAMFPRPSEDLLFRTLLDARPRPAGLY